MVNEQRKLKIEAKVDNLQTVMDFVDSELEKMGASMKVQMQMDLAVEELFVNIASYAYPDSVGDAQIVVEQDQEEKALHVSFIDWGQEYNPLEKEDPDITLSANDRQIGGLGIFMVKKNVDAIEYEYSQGRNIVSIVKKI